MSADRFVVQIDNMLESTHDLVADDEVTPDNDPSGLFKDIEALDRVRNLYIESYQHDPTS